MNNPPEKAAENESSARFYLKALTLRGTFPVIIMIMNITKKAATLTLSPSDKAIDN